MLLADACGGKKDFDDSFRAFVKELFPDKKLEPIPAKDDLYSAALNGAEITSVRCRRERADPQGADSGYQNFAPALEGIESTVTGMREAAENLSRAVVPLSGLAGRFPGSRKRAAAVEPPERQQP